ncbi:MAG: YafY family protein [Pseudomonadota bacterium]
MSRSDRMFEIIQILRGSKRSLTADELAKKLEVSTRTIYRDISALQTMQTPIEGEAGIGYVMRKGYDLPPLNFNMEEIEALRVGLLLLARTGDSSLQGAAKSIVSKVDALHGPSDWLYVSAWGAPMDDPERGCVSIAELRDAIRNSNKLILRYRDKADQDTVRKIRPFALVYHQNSVIVAAWCELRGAMRNFRTHQIYACDTLDETFSEDSNTLRTLWLEQYQNGSDTPIITQIE